MKKKNVIDVLDLIDVKKIKQVRAGYLSNYNRVINRTTNPSAKKALIDARPAYIAKKMNKVKEEISNNIDIVINGFKSE